ncbi:MFS transporter [Cupriavidus sp. CV2]|uniref:MFS transporter n=1 Tax=Cupriavidus ulmosensis TaxID=3065913 RepID=UPI00296A9FA0|nr:MFS transporter [Cupriavidus sp. CV2]MDW3688817.1 MFS transporter [Cupriavidus sp. CV2]
MTTNLLTPYHPLAEAPPSGRLRWLVLLIAWAALVLSTACRLAWGSLAIPLGQSLSLPLVALGMFVTAFYFGYVLSNMVCGFATDRVGGRIALSTSLLGLSVATFGFSYTPSLAVGLVLQALMGLTAGADYAAGVKLITVWFEKHERGRAFGFFMSASSVAVIVTNAVLPAFVEAYGWRNGYRGLGVLALVFALICAIAVRDRPSAGGVVALGETIGQAGEAGSLRTRIGALMTRNFLLLALAGCGAFWGTLGFSSWAIPLMVKGYAIPAVQAGFIVAMAGVAGLFAKPTVGWLSDRLGARRKALTVVSLLFFSAMLLVFGQLHDLTAFRIAAPFIGVGAFIYSPLLVTMVAEQAGLAKAGSAAGVANAAWQLGSALAPAFVGFVFQATSSFFSAFAVLAAGPLCGAICMAFVKERQGTDERRSKE